MEFFAFDLKNLEFWHWLSFGGALFVLEILSLSFFFLWLGTSAVIVGLIMLVFPDMAWQAQWGLWALMSVLDIFAWRIYKANKPEIETDEPHLNKRGDQYLGRHFTLEEPIKDGFGKVKVDDSIWKVACKTDLPAGTKIQVTAIEGTVLQVETAS